ncbi:hypothetical protein MBLNU459_g2597t1 [Dothideomycetes sp. NU459]
MSAPNKRRKKNTYEASPKTVRSIDHFFGKPKQNDAAQVPKRQLDDEILSDEALARKLQAEWDEQDQARATTGHGETRRSPSPPKAPEEQHSESQRQSTDDIYGLSEDAGTETLAVQNEALEQPVARNPFAALGKKNTLSLQSATADEDTVTHEIPFDQSPLTFDPTKYIADLKKQWVSEGGNATYALLTRCFILVNSTQSRIKIVDTLVNLLRTIVESDPASLLPAVWLATNSISPPYIDLELGLGGSAISKALKKVCGLDNPGLRKLYDKHGDAGDVAFEAKKRQSLTLRKPKPLTIKSVFDCLTKIANAKGQGSVETKQRIVERLVQDARGAEESRYIVRTLVQHLRIGAVKTTMLIALSRAFLLSRPSGATFHIRDRAELAKLNKQDLTEAYSRGEELVKACFARRPNYNDIVPTLLEIGISEELLLRCGLAMHIPLRPMLGGITRDLGEMLTKLSGRDFSCEYKYDGQRAQVHCDERGTVTIFSRHLEIMTDKYPDLVALVPQIRGEGVSSFIIEGEVVAIDRETGELKPFQILANRARKDVVIGSVKVDVCLFAFDLMYLNGEELLNRPFRERRSLLRSLFVEIPHHFTWVKNIDATSADDELVSDFFKKAVADRCEGFMAKVLDNLPNPDLVAELDDEAAAEAMAVAPKLPPTPSKRKKKAASKAKASAEDEGVEEKKTGGRRKALLSTYEPDKRVDSWLKVKKDYNTSASDTIDLIPIGGWHGQGRKSKWWSPILLGARDEYTGQIFAVTKCMSGFSDKFYAANKETYAEGSDNLIARPSYVEYAGEPAVWFRAHEVWEISFADVTLSPTYTAAIGLVSEERGLSLRFPRFLKTREDKSIDEASTTDFLAALYRKQEAKGPTPMLKEEGYDDDDNEAE